MEPMPVLNFVVAALVALLVLLTFINTMINRNGKDARAKQSVECAFQHENIGSKVTRNEGQIEKMLEGMNELIVITKDQAKTAARQHSELVNVLRSIKP